MLLLPPSIGGTEILCGAGAIVVAVQLFTPANPIGSSLRLLKQFRTQVCYFMLCFDALFEFRQVTSLCHKYVNVWME